MLFNAYAVIWKYTLRVVPKPPGCSSSCGSFCLTAVIVVVRAKNARRFRLGGMSHNENLRYNSDFTTWYAFKALEILKSNN